jgi:hypothetical protein
MSFRTSCLVVCVLYALLAGSILVRGAEASMAPFGVPSAVLASAHYQDAIFWVYSHQLVLGLLIGALGFVVVDPRAQLVLSRVLFAAHVYYAFLDFRSSDSPLGNALYQGPASLAPAIVCVVVGVLFAWHSIRPPWRNRPA